MVEVRGSHYQGGQTEGHAAATMSFISDRPMTLLVAPDQGCRTPDTDRYRVSEGTVAETRGRSQSFALTTRNEKRDFSVIFPSAKSLKRGGIHHKFRDGFEGYRDAHQRE